MYDATVNMLRLSTSTLSSSTNLSASRQSVASAAPKLDFSTDRVIALSTSKNELLAPQQGFKQLHKLLKGIGHVHM